jgi:hypothetical protein
MMNVGQLRRLIVSLPDDAAVVVQMVNGETRAVEGGAVGPRTGLVLWAARRRPRLRWLIDGGRRGE